MFIHNTSDSEKTYIGKPVASGAFYLISPAMKPHYASSEKLLTDIMSGDASISLDGVVDLDSKAQMVNFLVGSEVALSGKTLIQSATPVVNYKPEDASFSAATHDFTNKTTWYSNSVRVTDEVLTTSDSLTYSAVNEYFIDVINALVNRQDLHQDKAIEVKVNDVVVTDYTVNHREGEIVFSEDQTGKTIKCSYDYATSSEWVLSPEETKMLIIEHSEVQFSKDVEINTPLRFEIWVYNPYFNPELPIVAWDESSTFGVDNFLRFRHSHIQYNSVRDLVNEANLGTGYIPQMGDLPSDILVFPFNYISVKPFRSSQGAQLRIGAVDDVELTGSYGTATFYLMSRDDI